MSSRIHRRPHQENDVSDIGLIFNPHARRNRHKRKRSMLLQKCLGSRGILRITETVDEIPAALEELKEAGVRYLVADGGDGALHWVVNEAIRIWGEEHVRQELVFIPSHGGTIDFLARALGINGKPETIVQSLQQTLGDGQEVETVDANAIKIRAIRERNGQREELHRVAWAVAAAGYGANFYGPYYRSHFARGPVRIVALLAEGLSGAAIGTLFSGPLAKKKPKWIQRVEHDYVRSMRGSVVMNGKPFCNRTGQVMHEFNVVHAGSVRVNLGGVLKVFGDADSENLHVHVGFIPPLEIGGAVWDAARGREISHPDTYDGPARSLLIRAEQGTSLTPCFDGELFEDIVELELTPGPSLRFGRPRV